MRGWDSVRRASVLKHGGAVSIYRLSAAEYMAFILDSLNHKAANGVRAPICLMLGIRINW